MRLTTSTIKGKEGEISGLLFMATCEPSKIYRIEELPDRKVFDIVLDRELRRMEREHELLSLIKIDIDHSKAYREHHGQDAIETCLKIIAHTINERIQRAGDLLAFYGDDEFMIILPRTDVPGTVKVAEYLRLTVAGLEIEHKGSDTADIVTISCGVTTTLPQRETSAIALVATVEQALANAKADGRNCTRIGEYPKDH